MDQVKILAIDDNADNLVVLKALLGEAFPKAGFISALSGEKGIELCLTEKPNVILLDIVMPGMDGYEVCQFLKANEATKTIPVIMVTAARTDKESRIKALEFGADAFLAKPLDESELVAQIRAMVRIKDSEDRKLDEKERLKRLVEERTSQLEAELSERKRAEKALKQSEERFQLLFNQAPLGYQSLDFDGHFIEVNQQWLDTLGFTREEVIGKWFGDFLSPEYKEGFRLRFPLFKAQGNIHSEFEMVHKNGSRLFIAFEGKIGYNLDGGFKQTHCILQDITQSKKAEEALSESETRFRHISSSISDISFSCETDSIGNSTINWLYGAIEEITGYTTDELIAMKCWGKLVIAEDFPIFKSHILEVLPDCSDECQLRIRKKDGSIVWVQASAECAKGPVGSSYNILYGGLVDITNDKRTVEALQESEAMYHSFIEQLPNAVFRKDKEGRYILANSQFLKLKGLTGKELIGLTPLEVAAREIAVYGEQEHATHYASVGEEVHEQIMRTGKIFENEEVYDNHSDGTKWYMHVMRLPVMDSYGTIIGTQGIMFDISKRKLAEEALLESETQFREFFEKAADAIFIAEFESGIIVDVNEAACRLMQRSHNELVGIHQADLHPPVKENYAKDTFKKHKELVKQKLSSYAVENTVVRADGTEVPVEILASDVKYHGKHCLMGTFRNITERKQSELKLIAAKEKAEESDRLKSAFLANMSHEIRTPLNSIIGFSELLTDPDFNTDQQLEFAQMINASGTNLLTIISDIMDFSKIESGQIRVNKSRFMVNQLISDIQREYSYKAYENGIELRLDPASPSIETFLESDQNRIRQVLVNFVGNSIKFTAKGYIEIGFAIVEGFVQFHVTDTGIGIPKDFHKSVFERFNQVDSSSTRKYGGNGLGLAISKSLVEMLGGRIWLESEPDKGSAFYFTIPVQTPEVT
jgi:PAS domain S-box-containing protein